MNIADHLDLDQTRTFIGAKLPTFSAALPAAWWLTTDPDIIDGYDRYQQTYDDWLASVLALAAALGVKDAMANGRFVTGFKPTRDMRFGHTPIPAEWRLDPKENLLRPIRRTKADRESTAARSFEAIERVPQVTRYIAPMDLEVKLPAGSGSYTLHSPHYRRTEHAVIAVISADPDRVPGSASRIDTRIWHRQHVSVLAELVTEDQERRAADDDEDAA